jgi:hypothetical protein
MLSRSSPPKSRTVPIGNLMMRGVGALVALIAHDDVVHPPLQTCWGVPLR